MMENKNKVLIILMLLFTIFIIAQVLGPVSAAGGKKTIDKGIAPHKNYKSIKLNWTATIYNNNTLKVHRYFSKNGAIYKVNKVTFKRINKSKLKVFIEEKSNKKITKTSKYMKIKNNMGLESYYIKNYKGKILKNISTSKVIDSGSSYVSNIAHGRLTWSTRLYYNNKISIKEDISAINNYGRKIDIERNGKGKLKITTQFSYGSQRYDSKTKKYVPDPNKKVKSVKSKLSPKNYYLKVYKPRMTKVFIDHEAGCMDIHDDSYYISPETILEKEVAYGNLRNSSGKLEWTIDKYYIGKVIIYRNYTDNSFLNSTTIIEQFNKSVLKISVVYHDGNNSSQISYVNYSSNPFTYLSKVYYPEMLKLIVGNVTITNESYINMFLIS